MDAIQFALALYLRRYAPGRDRAITAAKLARHFTAAYEGNIRPVDIREFIRGMRLSGDPMYAHVGSTPHGGFYWIKTDAEYADVERNLKSRIRAIAEVLGAVKRNRRAFNEGRPGQQASLLPCDKCGGLKTVPVLTDNDPGAIGEMDCPKCGGTGQQIPQQEGAARGA